MKRQQSVGLVVEGNATSSAVLRLPSILDELGPVKAGVQRVARRLCNFLGAGYPIGSYDDLQVARLVLLRVPDESVPRFVEELATSSLVLKDLLFVLCESCMGSDVLAPLAERGAGTATLVGFPTPRKRWFVVEGQMATVRQIRRLLDRGDSRVFELKQGAKSLYLAAQLLATGAPTHLMGSAQQALRRAGIKGNHLHEFLEEMSLEMFRSFSNGARFTWPGARAGCLPHTIDGYLDDLRTRHPEIAADLEEQLLLAARRSELRRSD